jgi:tetratricopeptide (TPR) repeat protein
MDEELDGEEVLAMPEVDQQGADDNSDEKDNSDLAGGSGGSDDWGDLTIRGEQLNLALQSVVQRFGSSGVDEASNGMMFVPEPVMSLLNDSRPQMPLLSQVQLPAGARVWVTDEDDVKMLLKDNWDGVLKAVCNGRAVGKVLRHSTDDLAVVLFESETLAIKYTFTLPRVCLSTEAIEAYDSPKTRGNNGNTAASFAQSVGGVGNLGPRAGRGTAKTKEEVNILHQNYETMASFPVKCPSSDAAWALLAKGKLAEALAEINRVMEDDVAAEFRKEHLCIRSTIYLFLSEWALALKDALDVIAINNSWVKGYLRAARAYKAQGKYTLASIMINHSLLLLPHSNEILEVSSMNKFLKTQQELLDKALFFLSIRLNAQYLKRFCTKRGFQAGELLYSEQSDWIIAMPSMFNTATCCCVCLSSNNLQPMNLPTKEPLQDLFCSVACLQRSSLFFPKEKEDYEVGYRSAMSLVQAKSASSMNMLPLELARMTMRLFFMVCSTHERLVAQERAVLCVPATDPDAPKPVEVTVTVDDALVHLGIYPLASTTGMETKTRDDLIVLCNVMCQSFELKTKLMYTPQLFVRLFAFVSGYALYAESETHIKGYYVGKLIGAVDRDAARTPNCEVSICEGALRLTATTEILKDDPLIVAPLSTTQH